MSGLSQLNLQTSQGMVLRQLWDKVSDFTPDSSAVYRRMRS